MSDENESNLGLDPNRLSMLDNTGSRMRIIPAEVIGYWKKRRELVYAVLMVFFLVLPWTYINGVQTVLLDIPNRKFALFGITFWAHDAPMIFLLFAISVFGLAFVTSIWGRVWCGWACPQTVFIDFIYRRIERWVEGNYIQRRQRHKSEMTFDKAFRLSIKWFLFFVISSLIAHSFAAYFVGSSQLTQWIYSGNIDEHQTTFLIVTFITLVLLFDFGWFREQFCIIMCPYGRFQSVLMDTKSMAVLYDENRGEPRKGIAPPTPLNKTGDCVSCNRCVQVCPTGIDIRKGLQMECIACTACIDACDDIMTKVKKPTGLIKYATVSGQKNRLFHGRQLLYLGVIAISTVLLVYLVGTRKSVDFAVLRAQETPYQLITDEAGQPAVLNHFKIHVKNQTITDLRPELIVDTVKIKIQENPFIVKAGENETKHFFVLFDPKILESSGSKKINLTIRTHSPVAKDQDSIHELSLIGPTPTIKENK